MNIIEAFTLLFEEAKKNENGFEVAHQILLAICVIEKTDNNCKEQFIHYLRTEDEEILKQVVEKYLDYEKTNIQHVNALKLIQTFSLKEAVKMSKER